MKYKITSKEIQGQKIFFREGTSDENIIREVIEKRTYRRAMIGFDVEPGEKWLDLGGNIGAFAFYCHLKGARCDSYEPHPDCFRLLKMNSRWKGFSKHQSAISGSREPYLKLWSPKKEEQRSRGTIVGRVGLCKESITIPNTYAGELLSKTYDGVKIDIEGAEFDLIDRWLIPDCKKLCLEYHTSRDQSMLNLKRRLRIIQSRFSVVNYPPELDKIMKLGGRQKSFHDRVIWCIK